MCLLGLMLLNLNAQSKKEVAALLDEYEQLMLNREWKKSMDYMYPTLFDIVPREMMENAIVTTFSDTSVLKMAIVELELIEVGEIKKDDTVSYAFAQYEMVMTMSMTNNLSEDFMATLKAQMAGQYGDENVWSVGKTLFIMTNNRIAVMKNIGEDRLYMLEIKPELKVIMEQMMSQQFLADAYPND